jgi:hypothetical protein
MNRLSLAIGSILLGMAMTSHAQESTWDYTGSAMTGVMTTANGSVPFESNITAQLVLTGPSNDPVLQSYSVGLNAGYGNFEGGSAANPNGIYAITSGQISLTYSNGAINGASINILSPGGGGSSVVETLAIGPQGDSITYLTTVGNGNFSVELSNSTAGSWVDPVSGDIGAHAAPEITGTGIAQAFTLLGLCLLIMVAKARDKVFG